MKPMSQDQLEDAAARVLSNAKSLLADAELLMSHQRFARSASISVLALEELAKLPMLRRASSCVLLNKPFNWKKLSTRLKAHDEKLGVVDMVSFVLAGPMLSGDAGVEAVRKRGRQSNAADGLNRLKQAGFYVSVAPDSNVSPTDVITKEDATILVEGVRQFLSIFDQAERGVSMSIGLARIDSTHWQRILDSVEGFMNL
jgi:AbiV family abortive infection protein